MEIYERTISLGKVAIREGGAKVYQCSIEVNINNGRLSICGTVGNPRNNHGFFSTGQNQQMILESFPENKAIARMVEVWDEWHMNDMHAECEHQRAAGWREIAVKKVTIYNWTQTMKTFERRKKIEEDAMERLIQCGIAKLSEEDQKIVTLKHSFSSQLSVLPDSIAEYYDLEKQTGYSRPSEEKALGWLSPEEHPEGILGKPCPVCGYKYGSAWKTVELPPEIIDEVKSWTAETFLQA